MTVIDTQVDALAVADTPKARDLVYAALAKAQRDGKIGLTDTETARATGLYLNTAAPARVYLAKKGVVVDSGERRQNERGRKMIVWAIGCGCLTHPDRAAYGGDPEGCYCDCSDMGLEGCTHEHD